MKEFDKFIDDFLDKSGINDFDKIEKLIMSCFALISGYILRGKLIVGIQVKSS